MSKNNIVLIGMPGAGKSTIGVLLAKAVMMPFIDTDLLIQQHENLLLQDIINKCGILRLLEVEEEVIKGLDVKKCVVATGGSAVYSSSAMNKLKESGSIIVYLKLSYEEIEKRIKNIKSRGIAIDPKQSLRDLFDERTPLYEKYADVIINCTGKDMEDIVREIKDKI